MSRSASLERRVAAAAGETLTRQKAVTPIDVCVGIGWLSGSHVESWRQGRVGSLREFLPVDDARLLAVVASIRHEDTDYDQLLMSGVPRDEARDRIRPAIDRILASWA